MSLHLDICLYFAAAIFAIGVYGVLSRHNIIVILMSLELMLNAANLALIALGRSFLREAPSLTAASTPQVFVIIVLAVAAAEAAIGLSILLAVYRRWHTASAGEIHLLKG
jgi:NADH:ubiquinone oxidoreductase subunit K